MRLTKRHINASSGYGRILVMPEHCVVPKNVSEYAKQQGVEIVIDVRKPVPLGDDDVKRMMLKKEYLQQKESP